MTSNTTGRATAKRAPAKRAPKKPQDHKPPRVRGEQTVGRPEDDEDYRAHLEVTIDGKTYRSSMPVTDAISFDLLDEYGDNDTMFGIKLIKALFDDQPAAMAAIRGVSGRDLVELMRAAMQMMQDEQEVTAGESERSQS